MFVENGKKTLILHRTKTSATVSSVLMELKPLWGSSLSINCNPPVPREKQRLFQSIQRHTYLKGPMDKVTSVAIPLALAASPFYMIAVKVEVFVV
ncbi:hypothetical protein HID58_016258 [Brassica napus]|uniref:Uncharacterized protein n=1 Tax=Brassica napus TaxID=3708 RepID=A0ABQ8DPZ5_BRANA|nr:hypothetical protein HID58_016258 [Brassica napus]